MAYRTILLHLDHDRQNGVRLDLCLGLARDLGAHLIGLHVTPVPMLPYVYGEVSVAGLGPDFLETQRAHAAERAAPLRAAFEAAGARDGLSFEWRTDEGDAGPVVARHARYADLTVVGQTEPEALETVLGARLPEQVALGGGGPTLMVPYAGAFGAGGLGRRPLVAWNGSREAARALHDALPLLRARAEQVIVLEVDPPDDGGPGLRAMEAAKVLARHGLKVDAQYTVSGGLPAGDVLLSRLSDFGCDLLVMGAYGHSRARELVLGGATRSLLDHMTVPVLMAHGRGGVWRTRVAGARGRASRLTRGSRSRAAFESAFEHPSGARPPPPAGRRPSVRG